MFDFESDKNAAYFNWKIVKIPNSFKFLSVNYLFKSTMNLYFIQVIHWKIKIEIEKSEHLGMILKYEGRNIKTIKVEFLVEESASKKEMM